MVSTRLASVLACAALALASSAVAEPAPAPGTEIQVRANRELDKNTEKLLVIQTGDKREIRAYVTKAFEVKNTASVDIAGYLAQMVALEKGTINYVTAGAGQKQWIIVTVPDFMMPGIEETVKALDYKGFEFNVGNNSLHTKMRNRKASEVADLVRNGAVLSAVATVLPDDTTNVLYLADPVASMEDALDMVKGFDHAPDQVMIEAKIVEIDEISGAKLGLDWEAWKNALPTSGSYTFNRGRSKVDDASLAAGGVPFETSTWTSISPQAAAAFIEYLVDKGKARLLSTPRIVAVHGREAVISSTEDLGFTTIQQPSLSSDESAGGASRQRVDAVTQTGVILTVTPTIGSETLTLDLSADVSSVTGYTRDDRPIVSRRTATATAVLQDGEQFTLGGLVRESVVNTRKGIPLLMEVPLLQYLVSKEVEVKRSSQVVVFLTPKIVKAAGNPAMGKDKAALDQVTREVEVE